MCKITQMDTVIGVIITQMGAMSRSFEVICSQSGDL